MDFKFALLRLALLVVLFSGQFAHGWDDDDDDDDDGDHTYVWGGEDADEDDPRMIEMCDEYDGEGRVEWVSIEPCEWGPYGCDFIKGDTITTRLAFTPGEDIGTDDEGYNADNVIMDVYAKVGFFNDRYPHFDNRICDGHAECPMEEGETYEADWEEMIVPENFPSTHGKVKFMLRDETTDSIVACGRISMRYRKPGEPIPDDDD